MLSQSLILAQQYSCNSALSEISPPIYSIALSHPLLEEGWDSLSLCEAAAKRERNYYGNILATGMYQILAGASHRLELLF